MIDHLRTKTIFSGSRTRSRSILLGLPPLLIFIGSLLTIYLEGYCGSNLIFLLQEIAIALWGVELLSGILSLFSKRLRLLAITLILTLLISALLSWPLEQLSWWFTSFGPSPFCHFRN
jgi:hypothetical protein